MRVRWVGLSLALGIACGAAAYAVMKAAQLGAVVQYQATLIASMAADLDRVDLKADRMSSRVTRLENQHGREASGAATRPAASAPE